MPWRANCEVLSVLFVGLVLLCPGVAFAQGNDARNQAARAKFEAGKRAFAEGRYEDALIAFRWSYQLSARPQLQYNLGLAYDRLRRDEEALAAFKAYLTWDAKAERAVEVRARVNALEAARADRGPRASLADANQGVPVADLDEKQQRRRKMIWIGAGAASVVAITVLLVVLSTRGDSSGSRPEPNTGVRIESLTW